MLRPGGANGQVYHLVENDYHYQSAGNDYHYQRNGALFALHIWDAGFAAPYQPRVPARTRAPALQTTCQHAASRRVPDQNKFRVGSSIFVASGARVRYGVIVIAKRDTRSPAAPGANARKRYDAADW